MQRNDWNFEFDTAKVIEATETKIAYHSEHLEFWKSKREETMASIREDGIEINEKIALSYINPKARDWERGGGIMIRNDLRIDLSEVFQKLAYHTRLRDTYDGWRQALEGSPDEKLSFDIEDWLFFFGRDVGEEHRYEEC